MTTLHLHKTMPFAAKARGIIAGCICLAFASCSFGTGLADSKRPQAVSVEGVYGLPNGTVVQVSGRFEGWSGCNDNTVMKTRSDWTLTGQGRCIYVTGKRPRQAKQGKEMTIQARVIIEGYKFYLQYLGD